MKEQYTYSQHDKSNSKECKLSSMDLTSKLNEKRMDRLKKWKKNKVKKN